MITIHQKIAALKALERTDGSIIAQDVVTAASDAGHPLHGHFVWDDTEAARKYRLIQAQSLIRSIQLTVTVDILPVRVPAYVRDLRANSPGYRAVMEVRSEEDIARNTVLDAMARASNAIRRAKSLAAIMNIEELLEEADALIQQVVRRTGVNDQPGGEA